MQSSAPTIIALDVGQKRIGVAIASLESRLPSPLMTIYASDKTFDNVSKLINDHNVVTCVVGLPRGLDGQETEQTNFTRHFIRELKNHIDIPIHEQDESVTSKQAEDELAARGVKYNKGDVDALAATYILADFLGENTEV